MLSVIIPTCNAAQWLDEQLGLLARQTLTPDEILVVDSASDDGTQSIALAHPLVQLISIARETFDHGGTRSMAARRSRGEVLVFLTQDAIPANEHCLAKLTAPLRQTDQEGSRVAVCYGRQLPQANATPLPPICACSTIRIATRHHVVLQTGTGWVYTLSFAPTHAPPIDATYFQQLVFS